MRAIDINFSDRFNGTVKYLSLNLSFLCERKLLEMCINFKGFFDKNMILL